MLLKPSRDQFFVVFVTPCFHFYCRDVLELTEAIKIKDKEAEAYISEIEVPLCLDSN